MAAKDIENRVFVGGLSWDVTERQLEDAFRRFGKIVDCEIMVERGTGRPRGFGFLTFGDRRGMEDAIREMHGRELGDRIISVNRAEPKPGEDSVGSYGGAAGGGGSYSSGPRGGYRGSDRAPDSRQDECFKCGRIGHWARDCPSAGGGGGGRGGRDPPLSSRPRYGDIGSRGDRFSDRDRYLDDRYDAPPYAADRDRFDNRDKGYAGRDRFVADRYAPGDRYGGGDRFRGSDRYPQNGYDKDRGFDRDPAPRRIGDRYGGGGGAVRAGARFSDRPGPYDRPGRGGRQSSFDRY
ncbi:hypothetical protein V2J09_019570 [Rumex salicifolius]